MSEPVQLLTDCSAEVHFIRQVIAYYSSNILVSAGLGDFNALLGSVRCGSIF